MTQYGRTRPRLSRAALVLAAAGALAAPLVAHAGAQAEERLGASVVSGLQRSIGDDRSSAVCPSVPACGHRLWTSAQRLAARFPRRGRAHQYLATVHYEAVRAGLDPQIMLGVIYHESGFRKYAVRRRRARLHAGDAVLGQSGTSDQNLFNLRTNLRYGAVILRHYRRHRKGRLLPRARPVQRQPGQARIPEAVMAAANRYLTDAPVLASQGGVPPRALA